MEEFVFDGEILLTSSKEDTCTVKVKEEILQSSTVEDTCTFYVQEEVKMESTEIKGKH